MVEQKRTGRRKRIVAALRRRIIDGALAPGARISSREVRREFRACAATAHEAISRLVADGFLRTEARRGTFVSTTLPHLTNYGVVFGMDPLAWPEKGTFFPLLASWTVPLQPVPVARSGARRFRFFQW